MITTIDKAGRIVVPKELRDEVGLVAGPIDIHVVGNAIQIEVPETEIHLDIVDGFLTLPRMDPAMTDDEIRELRFALQR